MPQSAVSPDVLANAIRFLMAEAVAAAANAVIAK